MTDATTDPRTAPGDQALRRRAGDRGRRLRRCASGEIHALVGENGAGKSTLTKVMAGVVDAHLGHDAGRTASRSQPRTPLEARHLGIAMVFQETSLVPTMTVAQNLFLGQEKFFNRLRGIYIAAQQFLQSLNFDVDPTATVGLLGAAKKQMVEIARAVLHKARVIIFDEPTASLTPEEKKYFFDLVREPEGARRLGDLHLARARRGAADRRPHHGAARRQARRHRRQPQLRPRPHRPGDGRARPVADALRPSARPTCGRPASACCRCENLRMAPMVKNNSLSVFAGQVTGVFGLVGVGPHRDLQGRRRRHQARLLPRRRDAACAASRCATSSPAPAVRDGIAYVTEDRKVEGFFETMSIARNIYIGLLAKLGRRRPFVLSKESRDGRRALDRALNVRAIGKDVKVIELSGGNQQKVVIAKSLVQEPDLHHLRRADARRRRRRDRRDPRS